MKYMNMKKKYQSLDLQLFVGEDEDSEEKRRFTQEEVDEAVKKRLAREKRKWQRE